VRYERLTGGGALVNQTGCSTSTGQLRPSFALDTVKYVSVIPIISDNSPTPAVPDSEIVTFQNTRPTKVTHLAGGRLGQTLTILIRDSVTVFSHGGNLALAGPLAGDADSTLTLVETGGVWRETSRSVR